MNIFIIGAGRVGSSMGFLLNKHGYNVIGVYNKNIYSAKKTVKKIGDTEIVRKEELEIILAKADLIMITTPDDVIQNIVSKISKYNLKNPVYIMHMSGLHTSDILKVNAQENVNVFSLHPLQSIANFEEGIKLLPEATYVIEGNKEGKKVAYQLADDLKLNYQFIEKKFKPLYHASAVIASNYLVTLINTSYELLKEAGLENEGLKEGLLNLARGTLDNIDKLGPEDALTGPIERKDSKTIKKHQKSIKKYMPEYIQLYNQLGSYTSDMIEADKIKNLFNNKLI